MSSFKKQSLDTTDLLLNIDCQMTFTPPCTVSNNKMASMAAIMTSFSLLSRHLIGCSEGNHRQFIEALIRDLSTRVLPHCPDAASLSFSTHLLLKIRFTD